MANQIQATVYQIDGNPLSTPIQISFLTSDIMMKTSYLSTIPEVNTAITYYPNSSNLLQEQVFYVQENASDLVISANEGGTTQIYTTIHEIDSDPLIPNGVSFSFPANAISIWPSVNPATSVYSFIEFKNKRYYSADTEADLKAQANVNNALPYKVYTALLTQSGGSSVVGIYNGGDYPIVVGATYTIIDNGGYGWDFTNIGAPNNNIGTSFVATGTVPNSWGVDGLMEQNLGAPIATVLDNTIGDITWSYNDVGDYLGTLSGAFIPGKTWAIVENFPPGFNLFSMGNTTDDTVNLQSYDITYGSVNGVLYNTPIEIRVYN